MAKVLSVEIVGDTVQVQFAGGFPMITLEQDMEFIVATVSTSACIPVEVAYSPEQDFGELVVQE